MWLWLWLCCCVFYQASDLSTSIPLGHIATVTASKDTESQLDAVSVRSFPVVEVARQLTTCLARVQVLCKDFRTLVFVFEPVHTVRASRRVVVLPPIWLLIGPCDAAGAAPFHKAHTTAVARREYGRKPSRGCLQRSPCCARPSHRGDQCPVGGVCWPRQRSTTRATVSNRGIEQGMCGWVWVVVVVGVGVGALASRVRNTTRLCAHVDVAAWLDTVVLCAGRSCGCCTVLCPAVPLHHQHVLRG